MFFIYIVISGRTKNRRFGTQRQRSERGPTKSPRAPAIGLILYGNYTVRRAATRIKIPFWGFLFGEYGNLQSDGVTENILNKSSYKKSRRLVGFVYLKIFLGSLILTIPTIKSTNAHIQTAIPGIINSHPIVPINNIAIPSPERPA